MGALTRALVLLSLLQVSRGIEVIPARVKAAEQQFLEDLRLAAVQNPQTPLPSPWEGDGSGNLVVGNLGDIPIVTVTRKKGGGPMEEPGSMRRIAGEVEPTQLNQDASQPRHLLSMAFQSQWMKSKNGLLLKHFKDERLKNPKRVAIVIDSGDVIFGGCSEKHLMELYSSIVRHSDGAPVVASAEVTPFPEMVMSRYDRTDLEERRQKVLLGMDMRDNWVAKYATCKDAASGPCDQPPKYQYLNYGFLMGTTEGLYDLLYEVYKKGGFDQQRATEYMLRHPDRVTLDYTGHLAMSLHNLAEDRESPLTVSHQPFAKKKVVKNEVTGQLQCFIHGNGNGEKFVQRLAASLSL